MLPEPIKLLIASAVAYLVTEGEKVIGGWFGKDLGGVFAGFAAVVTTAVIIFAEALLGLVDFSEHNDYQRGFRCVACKCAFIAKLNRLNRDAQLRIGADDAGQDGTCWLCGKLWSLHRRNQVGHEVCP